MINICVQNMIELSVSLFAHTTLNGPYNGPRCFRQIHHWEGVSIVCQ